MGLRECRRHAGRVGAEFFGLPIVCGAWRRTYSVFATRIYLMAATSGDEGYIHCKPYQRAEGRLVEMTAMENTCVGRVSHNLGKPLAGDEVSHITTSSATKDANDLFLSLYRRAISIFNRSPYCLLILYSKMQIEHA